MSKMAMSGLQTDQSMEMDSFPAGCSKKPTVLTRPTPAAISPSRPESAKTASSPWDAPFHRQGRSEQFNIGLPSLLANVILGWPG
jgi:hypothetical protein